MISAGRVEALKLTGELLAFTVCVIAPGAPAQRPVTPETWTMRRHLCFKELALFFDWINHSLNRCLKAVRRQV